jgi:hypothetical protein
MEGSGKSSQIPASVRFPQSSWIRFGKPSAARILGALSLCLCSCLPMMAQSSPVVIQGVFSSNSGDQLLNPNDSPNAASPITPLINPCASSNGFTGTNCSWPITLDETKQWPDPDLSFSVEAPYNTSAYNVTWKMTTTFSDDCVLSHCNATIHPMTVTFTSTTTGDQSWSPFQSNPLPSNTEFGGGVVVQAQVKSAISCANAQTGTLTFKVLGVNPDVQNQTAPAVAESSVGRFGRTIWFLPNLINQESGGRQINPNSGRPQAGSTGDGDDNGLMQISRSRMPKYYANNNEDPYWNFVANVEDGTDVLSQKQQNSAPPCNTNQGEVTNSSCMSYAYDFWDRQVYQACVDSGGSATATRNDGLGTETCNVRLKSYPQYSGPALTYCTSALSWSDQSPAGHYQDLNWLQAYNGTPCGFFFLSWNRKTGAWDFHSEDCVLGSNTFRNYVVAVCQRPPAYH